MPDITMCKGTGCPQKLICYRATAKPDFLQSWFGTVPYDFSVGSCAYFVPVAEKVILPLTLQKRRKRD